MSEMPGRIWRLMVHVAAAVGLLLPGCAFAQGASPVSVANEVFVGSEVEHYLRWMQLEGEGRPYPWTIRSFSPSELERVAPRGESHPWAARYELAADSAGGAELTLLRPRAQAIYNSAFPYGYNDGAVWAGRGVTTAVQAGIAGRWGPVSVVVAPIVFRAENAAFALGITEETGRLAFADWRNPRDIDLPQRFGDGAYTRVDPGQSTLRIDLPLVTAGISTANQHWGPAAHYPIVLGNNAPGFPHAFLGSSSPVNVGVGRVHGRLVWGVLDQSEYFFIDSRRLMTGLVGSFSPRGLDGVELGVTRFFHTPWPPGGLSLGHLAKPLDGLFKINLPHTGFGNDSVSDPDNQIASVYLRASFPRSGIEVYGEYGREDNSIDLRDLVLEPDHSGGYLLGFRKRWTRSPERFLAFQAEVLNLLPSQLSRVRAQAPYYIHTAGAHQGHTQRGQILGAAAGYGGAASIVRVDSYDQGGRWGIAWGRTVQKPDEDVSQSLGVDALVFRGAIDWSAGVTGIYNFGRYGGIDVFNLNATLSASWRP